MSERCELSDLLVDQCACRVHAKTDDRPDQDAFASDPPAPAPSPNTPPISARASRQHHRPRSSYSAGTSRT